MPAQPTEWTVEMVRALPEVLSPSTLRTDRGKKRDLYQRKGVPEYWIVEVETRTIDRWRPNDLAAETLSETITWQSDRFIEPLTIDLQRYFARVLGEFIT